MQTDMVTTRAPPSGRSGLAGILAHACATSMFAAGVTLAFVCAHGSQASQRGCYFSAHAPHALMERVPYVCVCFALPSTFPGNKLTLGFSVNAAPWSASGV